jgi:anaerobic ribonucleoside-triphosphate reductase
MAMENTLKKGGWGNMETTKERKVCGAKTEVYSRIVGYFRPVANWNQGKKQEFEDRKTYNPNK